MSELARVKGTSTSHAKGRTHIAEIAQYFHKPINVAARNLNVCATVLKKICRQHGLKRWPSRRLLSLQKQIRITEKELKSKSVDNMTKRRVEVEKRLYDLKAEFEIICSFQNSSQGDRLY